MWNTGIQSTNFGSGKKWGPTTLQQHPLHFGLFNLDSCSDWFIKRWPAKLALWAALGAHSECGGCACLSKSVVWREAVSSKESARLSMS